MKPLRIMLIAAVGSCLAFAGFAQAVFEPRGATDQHGDNALRRRLPRVDFKGIPFKDALQFLCEAARYKMEVDWEAVKRAKVKLTPQTRVTLKAGTIPVAAALRQVLDKAAGPGAMDFVVEQGRVLILPKVVADGRFISRLDADLKAVNARAARATSLVKELLEARAGLPATRGRVAALEGQLRRTAGPLLRQIDGKLVDLRAVAWRLTLEGLERTTRRGKAVSERLDALIAKLKTIAGAGAWEPVPPPPAGKRRLLFRPNKTSRTYADPGRAGAPSKPRGEWTAEKGKVVLSGKHVEVTFHPDAPAAGDVELKTTLSFTGGKISKVQIILVFGAPGTKQGGTYACRVTRYPKPGSCELFCIPDRSPAARMPIVRVLLPALKEGKAFPLRLLIRGRKLTYSFANRTVSIHRRPLPAGAKLKYVQLIAGSVGGSVDVALDDFKITCADEGTAGKPKDEPAPAKAAAEQELQAANALKLADLNRKAGLRRTAIKFYEKIVKEYPATAAAKEAKEWLTILRP